MNKYKLGAGIVAVLCVFFIAVIAMEDHAKRIANQNARIEKYNTSAVDRITPFCRDGYSYLIIHSGTHSGIAGVSPEVGPDGFVEC